MKTRIGKKVKMQKIFQLLGLILVVIFTLCILAYFYILTHALLYYPIFDGDGGDSFWTTDRIIRRTFYIYTLIFLLVLSFCLAGHKKIVVLYLRKFHLNTNIISPNNKGGLGNKIRIVTLQDESFPSMALTRKDRIITYLTIFVISISAIYLNFSTAVESVDLGSESRDILIGSSLYVIVYLIWLGSSVIVFMLFYIKRLNKNKVIPIKKFHDVSIANSKVESLKFFIKRATFLGNRSTVIETSNSLWKEAVSSLIKRCNIAIIDISQLTDNIIWEIKESLYYNIPIIFIYSKETESQLETSFNQFSNYLNIERIVNIPTVGFSIKSENELLEFRNKLNKIIIEKYSYRRHRLPINIYHLKALFTYVLLFLLSIVFVPASIIIVLCVIALFS